MFFEEQFETKYADGFLKYEPVKENIMKIYNKWYILSHCTRENALSLNM